MGVFIVLFIHLVAFDSFLVPETFRLILNYRMLAFISSASALCVGALILWRKRIVSRDWETRWLFPTYLLIANLLVLYALSAEVMDLVDSGIVKATTQVAGSVKSLALSLLWAGYAILGLTLGILKPWRMLRLASLILLSIPIFKLFLIDSFELDQGYRVAAFLSLGGILVVGGFFYQRNSKAIRGFLFSEQ